MMPRPRFLALFPSITAVACLLTAAGLASASAAEPLYRNDFENAKVGAPPKDLLVIAGLFLVAEDAGNKFLELPGAPLDAFSALFGSNPPGDAAASARFHSTRKGRKFPTFSVSLNGVGGYRLQVSPAKKALELLKGDEVKQTVPFDWESDKWTNLKVQVRKAGEGCVVEGKAWSEVDAEPKDWTIRLEEKEAPAPGRAGIWGSPYAGTPIRFDDLLLQTVP